MTGNRNHRRLGVGPLLIVAAGLLVIVGAVLVGARKPDGRGNPTEKDPPWATVPEDVVFRSGLPRGVPLPWEDEAAFKDAVKGHGTPVRLAAFRAVLKEPIGSELDNIALAARTLAGAVVKPGTVFSQNDAIGPYSEAQGYKPGPNYSGGEIATGVGGGVCKISTALYNLTVLADLAVVERRQHTLIVPYVPPGQDATVTYAGGIDYRFENSTSGPILIWSELTGNTLLMAFYGTEEPPRVEWEHDIIARTPPTTEVRDNPELAPGESRVAFEGFEAVKVRSRALIAESDGSRRTRDLGVSDYRMAPRIEERSPQTGPRDGA